MSNPENPDRTAPAVDLAEMDLTKLLLYSLSLDDEDPVLGIFVGVRHELGLITDLAESAYPGTDLDLIDLVPVLEGIGRRLDAGIELIDRAKKGGTTSEPEAHETKPPSPSPSRWEARRVRKSS